jgi:hypothetical protein
MSSRFLIVASGVTLIFTMHALCSIALRRPGRYAALFLFLVVSAIYKAAGIAWSPSYEIAYIRECVFAVLSVFVALATLRRLSSMSELRMIASSSALVLVVACGIMGWFAMRLPGAHYDYRGLVPVLLAAAAATGCAAPCADHRWDLNRLNSAACWGLTMVSLSEAGHAVFHEWPSTLWLFGVLAYFHAVVYCWVMVEIATATKRSDE